MTDDDKPAIDPLTSLDPVAIQKRIDELTHELTLLRRLLRLAQQAKDEGFRVVANAKVDVCGDGHP